MLDAPDRGLSRLRANGTLLDVQERDGRRVMVLKCSECAKHFVRALHGTGMSARLQDKAYCSTRCSAQGNKKQFYASGGDSQLARFRFHKDGFQ